MNRKQLIVLWVGIGLVVAMGAYPPWAIMSWPHYSGAGGKVVSSAWYACIFNPPQLACLDLPRLFLQWGLVVLVTAAGMVSLRAKK